MDTRLELTEKLRIGIIGAFKHDIEYTPGEQHIVTQTYLLLQIFDKLDSMDKSLNLIAVQTSIIALQEERQDE